MMWHLLNGDNVLRFEDFAEIVRPRGQPPHQREGGSQCFFQFPGKKAKKAAASKPVARPSTRQKKAG